MNEQITEIVAGLDLGKPTAHKRGRDPRWPYVPVVIRRRFDDTDSTYQDQVRGLAYATREEAVTAASEYIAAVRSSLAERMADPRNRALREKYGLPREVAR